MNLYCYPCTALSTRFTASVMLAHESLLLFSHCPYLRGSQHLSRWLLNLYLWPYTALSTRFTAFFHAGSWISAVCLYTALSIRFPASVMLAHDSLPLVFILPCPRDSQHLSCWLKISAAFLYTALSTRFTASVMLTHESLPPVPILPCPRDSQHLSC
jgi:hypothetical protein